MAVDAAEFLFALFLIVIRLDDIVTRVDLFDMAVDRAEMALLAVEVEL